MKIPNMLLLLGATFGLLGQSVAVGHGHLDGLINETVTTGGVKNGCAGPSPDASSVRINSTGAVASVPGFDDKSTKTKYTATGKHHNQTTSTVWTPVTILDTTTAVLTIKPTNITKVITELSTIESTTTRTAKFASTTETLTQAVIVSYTAETTYTTKWLAPPQETKYTLTMISTSTGVSEILVVADGTTTHTLTSVTPTPTALVKRSFDLDEAPGVTIEGSASPTVTIVVVVTLPPPTPGGSTATQSSSGATASARPSPLSTDTSLVTSLETLWLTSWDTALGLTSSATTASFDARPSPSEENTTTTATFHNGLSIADVGTATHVCSAMHTTGGPPYANASSSYSPGRHNGSATTNTASDTTVVALVSRTTTVVYTVTETAGAFSAPTSSSAAPGGEPGAWGSAPGGGGPDGTFLLGVLVGVLLAMA